MGNNNNQQNNNNKKELEDKMEIKDEVKVEVIKETTPSVVKPNVTPVIASSNNKDEAIKKEIAELEKSKIEWQKIIDKTLNCVDKAIYADKILQANIKISELRGQIGAKEISVATVENVAKIGDPKPAKSEGNVWRF